MLFPTFFAYTANTSPFSRKNAKLCPRDPPGQPKWTPKSTPGSSGRVKSGWSRNRTRERDRPNTNKNVEKTSRVNAKTPRVNEKTPRVNKNFVDSGPKIEPTIILGPSWARPNFFWGGARSVKEHYWAMFEPPPTPIFLYFSLIFTNVQYILLKNVVSLVFCYVFLI